MRTDWDEMDRSHLSLWVTGSPARAVVTELSGDDAAPACRSRPLFAVSGTACSRAGQQERRRCVIFRQVPKWFAPRRLAPGWNCLKGVDALPHAIRLTHGHPWNATESRCCERQGFLAHCDAYKLPHLRQGAPAANLPRSHRIPDVDIAQVEQPPAGPAPHEPYSHQ